MNTVDTAYVKGCPSLRDVAAGHFTDARGKDVVDEKPYHEGDECVAEPDRVSRYHGPSEGAQGEADEDAAYGQEGVREVGPGDRGGSRLYSIPLREK